MNYITISLREAIEKEWLSPLSTDFDLLEDSVDSLVVRIYEGDTTLQEAIDLYDLYYEQNTAGIIVNGNLTVHAPVIDFELDTYSCFLIVNGSLSCTTLAAGCAEIIINGNVNASEAVVCFHNHGIIEIAGDVNSNLLVVDDHGIDIKGNINATTYCRGWHVRAADYTKWRDILLPEVANALIDEDDYLFAGDPALLKLLRDGKPVFKQHIGKISVANNPKPVVATWEEVKPLIQHLACKYEEYPFAINERQSGMAEARFLLYNGTTVLNELNLDWSEDAGDDYMGIIVVGNLQVNGSIINENTDGARSLIVLGNLRAKNVCVGGQLIYINGYIAIDEMLMGIYNHGELYGKSYVWCPAVITDDYRFYFEDYAGVKVLDVSDDDDRAVIKEKLIDELFDEEEGYVIYDTIHQGIPLLRQPKQRTEISVNDLTALLNIPLFGPNNLSIDFTEEHWYITISRGGMPDEDGEPEASSVIAINIDLGQYYMWYLESDNVVGTLIRTDDENWVAASPEEKAAGIQQFTVIETLVARKVRWNNKHIKTLDNQKLWELIWMFKNQQTDEEFRGCATVILNQVLYAALYPFAYIFVRYKEESDYRGLAETPEWAHAAALIDGLIQWGLVQEITRRVPLAEKTEELFAMTQYCWGYDCEVDPRYATQPIDREFVCELNEVLLPTDSVMLRLDVGIRPYLITGMHLTDLEKFNALTHPLGIFPKFFAAVTEEEETNLKKIANDLLTMANNNDTDTLHAYRPHQELLWNYVYNERGDVAFWQAWIERLQRYLIEQAGFAYIDRDEEDAEPIHPELNHWITWCETYEAISKQCNIILPGED